MEGERELPQLQMDWAKSQATGTQAEEVSEWRERF